jgi:hypothetical protein
MAKPYTAASAPVVTAALPGTTQWVKEAEHYSGGALWNNGTFVNRDIRGKPGQISNHARGIAMDLSFRRMEATKKGVPNGRARSLQFINACIAHWETLGLMLIIDYWPADWGRSWRCDRAFADPKKAWRKAEVKTFTGAPGGDWWHVEITPELANDPTKVKQAFTRVFGVSTTNV